jgi:hypothetical protein
MSDRRDPKEQVLREVQERNDGATNLKVTNIMEFLDGTLYTVTFTTVSGSLTNNYVYFHGDTAKHFFSGEDIAREVGHRSAPGFARRALETTGVSGIVALAITVAICFIAVNNSWNERQVQIPEVLANALTVILGFYFGTQVQKGAKGT